MALIADSGALYALYDSDDAHHHAIRVSTSSFLPADVES